MPLEECRLFLAVRLVASLLLCHLVVTLCLQLSLPLLVGAEGAQLTEINEKIGEFPFL